MNILHDSDGVNADNVSYDRSGRISTVVINLLYYISNMFLDDNDHDHPAKIDRKQLQKINEKKLAQGMKLE